MTIRRSFPSLTALVAVALIQACASAQTATTEAPRGRIVEGPSNITSFRPEERATAEIDLDAVSFRDLLERTGERGILWYQHVQTLANPYFEGRVNGSAGTERARDYMEFYFRLYGLEPAFPGADDDEDAMGGAAAAARWTSYRQPFEFSAGRGTTVEVDVAAASIGNRDLNDGADFVVLGNSGSNTVTGPLTFVGYGIDEGVEGYSSFDDDSNLTGRIAVLLRYEPLDEDGVSRWADTRFSPRAGLAGKMSAVVDRGAEAIILVNPPGCRDGRTGLEPIDRSRRFGRAMDVPVIQMDPALAEDLLAKADPKHRDLMTWRRLADAGEVTTVNLADDVTMTIEAKVDRTRLSRDLPAANVGAILPGHGDLADEYVVIGGHYDHNGYGNFGTQPGQGPLFPGADDNASGVAGMLVLAKTLTDAYAEMGDTARRSVFFIAFDAEERGLHGSRHYSTNTTIEPDHMTVLLNMDMVGRLRSNNLSVLGTGTAEGLEEILRPHFEASGLTVAQTPSGSGRSDDANFNRIGVPAMHFFTGMHAEYTTPQDHAYTVNPIGAAKIVGLMEDIALDLATRPDKLVHTTPGARPQGPGQNRGYAGVRLGIQPGMGADLETGILVEAVSEGTSAADGGIQPGDVMLQWNDIVLDSMRTLVETLREHEPGDVVTIKVKRGEETIDLKVTLKGA